MCSEWYKARAEGAIRSNNFQLHPPRGEDHNIIRNSFGNLSYPLLFSAIHGGKRILAAGLQCGYGDPWSVRQSRLAVRAGASAGVAFETVSASVLTRPL